MKQYKGFKLMLLSLVSLQLQAQVSSFPHTEGFEGTSSWTNTAGDDIDWIKHSGSTTSSYTGPSSAYEGTYYFYVETSSPNSPSKTAILLSPVYSLSGKTSASLTFRYHMYGATMGTLQLQTSTNGGSSWATAWAASGDKGNTWLSYTKNLDSFCGQNLQIRFHYTSGSSYTGDVALDLIIMGADGSSSSGGVLSPSSNQNYIQTSTPKTSAGQAGETMYQVQYFDGLGRPSQRNLYQASGDGTKDIITSVGYDGSGRKKKQYLPFASAESGGYHPAPANPSNWSAYYGATDDDYAFSQTQYEVSPLNRVKKQAAPGNAWYLGSDREVKLDYDTNTTGEVEYFYADANYNLVHGTDYAAGELFKTTTWDENNSQLTTNSRTEEFKDKLGRVVLKRSYDGSLAHSTYYVYNDLGLLCFVIPPQVIAEDGVSSAELSGLCYQYKYGERKRMTEKKLPGADWVYMVYDKRDRLRMTQDGQQRPNKQWLYTKYDQLNRPVITGIYTHGSIVDADAMQDLIDASSVFYESRNTTSYTANHGYTNAMLPISDTNIQTVIYYDDYVFGDFASSGTYDNSARYSSYHNAAYNDTRATSVKGQLTGKKVKAGSAWLGSVFFYDKDGRNIMSWSQNNLSGFDVVENQFHFTGEVEKSRQTHKTSNISQNLYIETYYYYDHMGRPDYTAMQMSGYISKPLRRISENEYNEIGQLITKKLNFSDGTNFTQQADYSYNIRGWLKSINNPKSLGSDYFGLTLDYETTTDISVLSAKEESYNGNISGIVWAGKYGATSTRGGAYAFQYDGLNRLKLADYGSLSGSTITDQTSLYNVTNITYDKNGNILTLNRDGSSAGIDKLAYGYYSSSNQLKYVNDTGNDAIGFKELGGNNSQEYYYDSNGNMVQDHNKKITSNITYNHFNLPTALTQNGTNISYLYDAEGNKLKSTVGSTVKDYDGQFIYEGSALSQILFSEGRIVVSGTSATYEFFMKDHLGNTRVTFNESGGLVQTLAYYPFGMEMTTDGNVDNQFRYNGKEMQEGTDWYDYGARMYDPALARFTTIDPLAEKYSFQSPFGYAVNNPIRFTDFMGMGPDDKVETETETNSGITISYRDDADSQKGSDYVQENSTTTTTTTFPGDHESAQSQTVTTTTQTTVVVDKDGNVSKNAAQVTTSTVSTTDKFGKVTTSDPIVNATAVKTSGTSSDLQAASQFAGDFKKDNGQSVVQAAAEKQTKNIETVSRVNALAGVSAGFASAAGIVSSTPLPGGRTTGVVLGVISLTTTTVGIVTANMERNPNNINLNYKK